MDHPTYRRRRMTRRVGGGRGQGGGGGGGATKATLVGVGGMKGERTEIRT